MTHLRVLVTICTAVIDLHVMLQKFIKNAYSYCVDVELDNVRIETSLARAVENLIQVLIVSFWMCVLIGKNSEIYAAFSRRWSTSERCRWRLRSSWSTIWFTCTRRSRMSNRMSRYSFRFKPVNKLTILLKDTGEQRKGKKGAKARKRMTEVGQQVQSGLFGVYQTHFSRSFSTCDAKPSIPSSQKLTIGSMQGCRRVLIGKWRMPLARRRPTWLIRSRYWFKK